MLETQKLYCYDMQTKLLWNNCTTSIQGYNCFLDGRWKDPVYVGKHIWDNNYHCL